jgi:hypothetical protein
MQLKLYKSISMMASAVQASSPLQLHMQVIPWRVVSHFYEEYESNKEVRESDKQRGQTNKEVKQRDA